MSAFETLRKVNRYRKSSLKCCLGCSQVLSMAWPTVIPATRGVSLKYLNLKLFHSHSCKESL